MQYRKLTASVIAPAALILSLRFAAHAVASNCKSSQAPSLTAPTTATQASEMTTYSKRDRYSYRNKMFCAKHLYPSVGSDKPVP